MSPKKNQPYVGVRLEPQQEKPQSEGDTMTIASEGKVRIRSKKREKQTGKPGPIYWRPMGAGYTENKEEAGIFTREQARGLTLDSRSGDNVIEPVEEGTVTEIEEVLPEGFEAVESSLLKAVAFTGAGGVDLLVPGQALGVDVGELQVIFKGGARWRYKDVPCALVATMMSTQSVGKFFNANIKKAFEASAVMAETNP